MGHYYSEMNGVGFRSKSELNDEKSLEFARQYLLQMQNTKKAFSFRNEKDKVTMVSKHWITTEPSRISYEIHWKNQSGKGMGIFVRLTEKEFDGFFKGKKKLNFSKGFQMSYD